VPNATPTPTPAATATSTATPPTGAVEGVTGTPGTTLPPTDTLATDATAPAGESWRLILLAMVGLLAAALLLTPATVVIDRKDRR
ncbi:MAG: cell wall anchor protein, partial [Candidatus Limnocylindrales bacterium]